MFILTSNHGIHYNLTAVATEHETSVFPVLRLQYTDGDVKIRYQIQRANWGLPGYYVQKDIYNEKEELVDSWIYTGYLPEQLGNVLVWKLPESVIMTLVDSYVKVALANLFNKTGWKYQTDTYDNKVFPSELRNAIEEFKRLELKQILGTKEV